MEEVNTIFDPNILIL